MSPELGNVCFASTSMDWIFTLDSFAAMYAESSSKEIDTVEFAKRLWGNVFYTNDGKFTSKSAGNSRTFCHFCLDPLYKLYSSILTGGTGDPTKSGPKELGSFLSRELGIKLRVSELQMDIEPLLALAAGRFFPNRGVPTLVSMVTSNVSPPVASQDGPLIVHIVKHYNSTNMASFSLFGRVVSGVLTKGMQVRCLGESDDLEDQSTATIEAIHIFQSR